MSHVAQQRVVVRMLFDPTFAAAVRRDPERALAGLPLSAAARRQLAEADARAFAVDPQRPHRALTALLAELATSAAALCRPGGAVMGGVAGGVADGVGRLGLFFANPRFHDAIQQRRSLALAFADYLDDLAREGRTGPDLLARGLIAIERALSMARRGTPTPWSPGRDVRLTGGARLVEVASGALDAFRAYSHALRAVAAEPVAALLAPGFEPPRVTVEPAERELILVEHTPDGATLELTSPELYRLLDAAAPGASRAALVTSLEAEGLDDGEARELLDELIDAGLLETR